MKSKNRTQNHNLSDSSVIAIPLRNLITIIIAVGIIITGYFNVTERISFLEHNTKLANVWIEMNSNFRTKWPLGELGALPDDAEQNMRLTQIEKQIQEIITASAEVMKGKSKAELEAIYSGIVSAIKDKNYSK